MTTLTRAPTITSTETVERLAIDGGPKVRATPFPPRRLFGEEEKRAVMELFDRSIQTGEAFGYSGEEERRLGEEFAAALGGGFADGVNSGTSAVYVALRSLDLEPWTEVIVPPITDPGGVMPVAIMNCVPVPADCAPGSYNTSGEQIAARLTERTSAILVAHIAGIPVDMDPIVQLARQRGLPVVEDCAQAPGATYKGQPVGTFGEVAAFSTMFGKHFATGGQGGVVFTKNEERYWKIRRCADRGKPFNLPGAKGNVAAALNCNMDELHAAIGRVQLRKLPGIVARRRRLALALEDGCRRRLQAVRMLGDPPFGQSSFWFLFFEIDASQLKVDKAAFVAALAAEGIPAGASYLHSPALAPWMKNRRVFGSSGLPWENSAYRGDQHPSYPLPNTLATDASHFLMPLHENLTEREVADILRALEKVEKAYII